MGGREVLWSARSVGDLKQAGRAANPSDNIMPIKVTQHKA